LSSLFGGGVRSEYADQFRLESVENEGFDENYNHRIQSEDLIIMLGFNVIARANGIADQGTSCLIEALANAKEQTCYLSNYYL